MSKFREFWQLVRDFGSTMVWTVAITMVCMLVAAFFWGFNGMLWVYLPALAVVMLLARWEDLIMRPAKKVWVAVVALTVFAFLCWLSATTFTTVVTGALGMAASIVLSLLVAFRYAGSQQKGWYHGAAILTCIIYLAIGVFSNWAFTGRQQLDMGNRFKNAVQTVAEFFGTKSDVAVADVSRQTRIAQMDSKLPIKVVLHNPGSPEDFRDDTGRKITTYQIKKDDVARFFPEDPASPKTFNTGEPFGKIRIETSGGTIAGWLRYEVIRANMVELSQKVKITPIDTVPPSFSRLSAALASPTTPLIPPRPATPVVIGRSDETVTAKKGTWTITQVAGSLYEHLWLGPFPSLNDARRLVVCFDGGTPVFLEPYLWSIGKYGTRIHRMSGDHATQFLWVQVSDGPDLQVRITKNRP